MSRKCWILMLLVLLSGCLKVPGLMPGAHPAAVHEAPLLTGSVAWSVGLRAQATSLEVASLATVSLIDPGSGETVTTALTDDKGAFSLKFKNWSPQPDTPYLVEAVKGLSAGGAPNRPGASGARLRTLVAFTGGSWKSLTTPKIQLDLNTTALAVIASLKGLAPADLQGFLESITLPATFTTPDPAKIAASELSSVAGLAALALASDQDPMAALARNAATGQYVRLERGPLVTDYSALSGDEGAKITLYGRDLALALVGFNGNYVAPDAGATDTKLVVTIPTGVSTGPLTVKVGNLIATVGTYTSPAFTIATFAGTSRPAPSTLATNWAIYPRGMAADNLGNLYFTSDQAHQVFKVNLATGFITLVAGAGQYGMTLSGPATSCLLQGPQSVAVHPLTGELYIADTGNNRICKVDAAGNLSTFAGPDATHLQQPWGMAFDSTGILYVLSRAADRVTKLDASGVPTLFAGTGSDTGENVSAVSAKLDVGNGFGGEGAGIAVGPDDAVYLSLYNEKRIRKVVGGLISTVQTLSVNPACIAVDKTGNLYISTYWKLIKRSTSGATSTFAGDGSTGNYAGENIPLSAERLINPSGLAFDANDNLFVSHTLFDYAAPFLSSRIRCIASPSNTVRTVAGNGLKLSSGDGGPALNAQIFLINSVTWGVPTCVVDGNGNVYFSETGSGHKGNRVRMVRKSDGVITTVAGTGASGTDPDGTVATSAKLMNPSGLAFDNATKTLYICEFYGNRVRKVVNPGSPGATIQTVAGNSSSLSGTPTEGGSALGSTLDAPTGLAWDSDTQSLFIASRGNNKVLQVTGGTVHIVANAVSPMYLAYHRATKTLYIGERDTYKIIKIVDPANSSVTSSVVGTGTQGIAPDGVAAGAKIGEVLGLCVTDGGTLYFSDTNYRVRSISNGQMKTIAGNGAGGTALENVPALTTPLYNPAGLSVDPNDGTLYFAELGTNRIRRLFK
ncbi:hypothetical protein J7643_16050 [bacterium]|nr:hypothetical protein [bacterium]